MLPILGSATKLCDGLTRRDFLRVGGFGALALSDLLRARALQAAPKSSASFGRARACILLFPYGSPPQHETFDPKPNAAVEVQGEMKAIASNVPGLHICDHLPNIATIMDRVTVVRSMTHPYPVHGVAYAVTGIPTYDPSLEARARDSRHWPFIGSIVDYLEEQRSRRRLPEVPRNVALPWVLNSKTDLLVNAGPYAAFLGQAYDPVWTDFDGPGTHVVPRYTDGQTKDFHDPFGGTTAAGRFKLSAEAELPTDLTTNRFQERRSLLDQFDRARRQIDTHAGAGVFDKFQEMAFSLITSGKMRQALDIGQEPTKLRESYGMTLFGQGCLAARRLVEAGCKFVTVFWDGFGQFGNCAWDTHNNHYPRLKEYLLPGFDHAYPALLRDLEARGLLDETAVLWMSEHGRTPQIDSKPRGAGRHHWSQTYSAAFAGGGFARGKVVGASDKIGGEVKDNPISPKDILATTFHLLGIDPDTTITDQQGRRYPIAGDGTVRWELLG
jgi:hypothetical protein